MAQSSLLGFLESYKAKNPNDVYVVEDEIDLNYEPTAYYKALEDKSPLIWFKKIKGYSDFELVTNVLGSMERMAFAIGSSEEDLYRRWNEIVSNPSRVAISQGPAPVKEVVSTGGDADLFTLPVPKHFMPDGRKTGLGRYITGGLAIARDPLNYSTVNMSYTRIQIVDKARYSFDMGSRGHLWRYFQIAKEQGKTLPITVIIGAHPLYYMLAASFIENEYARVSNVLGESSTHVAGELNDIPIPSDAEIAIEAEALPEEHFDEGPFSEFTGYVATKTQGNVARVKSILRKRNPVFYDITPSNSREHVALFSIPRNAAIMRAVKEFMPPSESYHVEWPLSSSHFMAFCSIARPEPGLAKQMGLALLGLDPLFTKIVIVNEGKMPELGIERLLMNLALVGAKKGVNVDIIPGVFCIKLDPSSNPDGTNGKAVIITRSSDARYEKVVTKDKVSLVAKSARVVFSHEPVDKCQINVVVGEDIDLKDPDQIVWAIATRVRPDRDIRISKGRFVIRARKKSDLEIPQIPSEVSESIGARLGVLVQGSGA